MSANDIIPKTPAEFQRLYPEVCYDGSKLCDECRHFNLPRFASIASISQQCLANTTNRPRIKVRWSHYQQCWCSRCNDQAIKFLPTSATEIWKATSFYNALLRRKGRSEVAGRRASVSSNPRSDDDGSVSLTNLAEEICSLCCFFFDLADHVLRMGLQLDFDETRATERNSAERCEFLADVGNEWTLNLEPTAKLDFFVCDWRRHGHMLGTDSIFPAEIDRRFTEFTRSFRGSGVNYQLIKQWLSRDPVEKSSAFKIRLIECRSYKVKELDTSERYVALSYVWGAQNIGPKDRCPEDTEIGKDYPLTIKDAIEVAQGLGFSYLWVDKYCIDQKDSVDKANQIQNMHSIYQNADATIIAASGDDAAYGLPGVSKTKRIPPKCIAIADRLITWHAQETTKIQDSKWNQRGWTLQEYLMSRHLIFFTDSRTVYQYQPRHSLDRQGSYPQSRKYTGVDCALYPSDTSTIPMPTNLIHSVGANGTDEDGWLQLIEVSSRRELSFADDRLDCIAGILNVEEERQPDIYFLWGLPVSTKNSNQVLQSLSWYNSSPGNRRSMRLPSWSWSGWTGGVNFPSSPYLPNGCIEVTNLPSLRSLQSQRSVDGWNDLQPRLTIQGSVFKAKLFHNGTATQYYGQDKKGMYCREVNMSAELAIDVEKGTGDAGVQKCYNREWTILVLAHHNLDKERSIYKSALLVLEPVKGSSGHFERYGMIRNSSTQYIFDLRIVEKPEAAFVNDEDRFLPQWQEIYLV